MRGIVTGLALLIFQSYVIADNGAKKTTDADSILARLAASLKPGTWALLNKDGDDSGYGAKFTDSGITINTRNSEVFERELDAPKWTKFASVKNMTYFGIAASYNPVHKAIVFGGGSQAAPPWTNVRKWYLLDAKGIVTPLVKPSASIQGLYEICHAEAKALLER